jgi:hypothetical protein
MVLTTKGQDSFPACCTNACLKCVCDVMVQMTEWDGRFYKAGGGY